MKWSEFKKHVDEELGDADPEVLYIDTSYPDENSFIVEVLGGSDDKTVEIFDGVR